jgi:hypothetical protein
MGFYCIDYKFTTSYHYSVAGSANKSSQYSAALLLCGITIIPPIILATDKISYTSGVVNPIHDIPKMILDAIVTTQYHT